MKPAESAGGGVGDYRTLKVDVVPLLHIVQKWRQYNTRNVGPSAADRTG